MLVPGLVPSEWGMQDSVLVTGLQEMKEGSRPMSSLRLLMRSFSGSLLRMLEAALAVGSWEQMKPDFPSRLSEQILKLVVVGWFLGGFVVFF